MLRCESMRVKSIRHHVIDNLSGTDTVKRPYTSSCRNSIDFDEMAGGLNKRRMIQTAVFKELMKVCHAYE